MRSGETSVRQPVLFLGHGSPMNAIEDNRFHQSWANLGAGWADAHGRPQLILCISAHWLTRGWWLTAMERPPTIHDFGGFPRELFEQQYPAPGAPDRARQIAERLQGAVAGVQVGLDTGEWGFDHGSWGVIKPMFPAADIPMIQLSMDYHQPPAVHFALGRALRGLRDEGVLVVGSGNIVHNLRTFRMGAGDVPAHDWARQFDAFTAERIETGDLQGLCDFLSLGAVAHNAHPTYEHYLPLLYAAGAVHEGEKPQFFNTEIQAASIAMRSVLWM